MQQWWQLAACSISTAAVSWTCAVDHRSLAPATLPFTADLLPLLHTSIYITAFRRAESQAERTLKLNRARSFATYCPHPLQALYVSRFTTETKFLPSINSHTILPSNSQEECAMNPQARKWPPPNKYSPMKELSVPQTTTCCIQSLSDKNLPFHPWESCKESSSHQDLSLHFPGTRSFVSRWEWSLWSREHWDRRCGWLEESPLLVVELPSTTPWQHSLLPWQSHQKSRVTKTWIGVEVVHSWWHSALSGRRCPDGSRRQSWEFLWPIDLKWCPWKWFWTPQIPPFLHLPTIFKNQQRR